MQEEELSNSAIALLCEIGEFSPEAASAEQKTHLGELIAGGFIEVDSHPALPEERFKLTKRGNDFLSLRGAGLNEA
jgi:hypothetical protein